MPILVNHLKLLVKRLIFVRSRAGFTFIELLIVITILGILAAAILIAINPVKRMQEARDATRFADTATIRDSISGYFVTHLAYPPDPALSTDTEFASDEGPDWIPGMDRLPQDPSQALVEKLFAALSGFFKTHSLLNPPAIAADSQMTFIADSTGSYIDYRDPNNPSDYKTCTVYPASVPNNVIGLNWNGSNGYHAFRTYLSFSTSTLPSNAFITSAQLILQSNDSSWTSSFNLNLRDFDWGTNITCPGSGTDDWGGNPPNSQLAATLNSANINVTWPMTAITLNISDISSIKKTSDSSFMLSTDSEENNLNILQQYIQIASASNSTAANRPKLIVSYTTPPPESPPPKGCKNKKKIYCYMVPADRQSATLWAVLENEDDERIYNKPTAKCQETPPPETYLNYCIKDP